MAIARSQQKKIADIARRLLALRAESMSATSALGVLAAQRVIAPQAGGEQALHGAFEQITGARGAPITAYVHDAEAQNRGDDVLRFFTQLAPAARRWRGTLLLVATELAVLLLVVMIYAIFVLPMLKRTFDAAQARLPPFTELVFAIVSPSSPLPWLVLALLLLCFAWNLTPRLFGPLLGLLDRFVLALPELGDSIRRRNALRLSGWLGLAAADDAAERQAIDAAAAWHGGIFARRLAALPANVTRQQLSEQLSRNRDFDDEFLRTLAIPDRGEAHQALRARWRLAAERGDEREGAGVLLVHLLVALVVAQLIVAMYLPIFKLAAVL